MYKRVDKKCKICGEDLFNVAAQTKFCPICAKLRKRGQNREYMRSVYQKAEEKKAKKIEAEIKRPKFLEFFDMEEKPKENTRPYKLGTHHLNTVCEELSAKKMSYAEYQKQKTFEMIKEMSNEQSVQRMDI